MNRIRWFSKLPCTVCRKVCSLASGSWGPGSSRVDIRAGFLCFRCSGNPDQRLQGLDRMDLLIVSGWGDVPQAKIPKDVHESADSGRFPRKNPHKRRNDNWRVPCYTRPRKRCVMAGRDVGIAMKVETNV